MLNTYIGTTLLLCRVEASGAAIQAALSLPEVARIELPPQPDLQSADLGEVTIGAITVGEPPLPDAVKIGVIDTGVNSGHPLLEYVVAASFSAGDLWPDADEDGHGTSVASIAASDTAVKLAKRTSNRLTQSEQQHSQYRNNGAQRVLSSIYQSNKT